MEPLPPLRVVFEARARPVDNHHHLPPQGRQLEGVAFLVLEGEGRERGGRLGAPHGHDRQQDRSGQEEAEPDHARSGTVAAARGTECTRLAERSASIASATMRPAMVTMGTPPPGCEDAPAW